MSRNYSTPETSSQSAADVVSSNERQQAGQFLRTLFAPDDIIEVRPIEVFRDDRGTQQSTIANNQRSWGTIDETMRRFDHLKNINTKMGLNIFFGVHTRTEEGRKTRKGAKEHVKAARCVYVDIDHVSPDAALYRIHEAGLPDPTVVINSGHGTHVYWVLEEPFDLTSKDNKVRMENDCERLANMLEGGDARTRDVSRVLRIPGFANVKYARNGEPPTPCVLHRSINDHRYDLGQLEEYLPEDDTPAIKLFSGGSWSVGYFVFGMADPPKN
jgi:hypothetical protein